MPEGQKQFLSKQNEQKLLSLWILSSSEGSRQQSKQGTVCIKTEVLQSRRIKQAKRHVRMEGMQFYMGIGRSQMLNMDLKEIRRKAM